MNGTKTNLTFVVDLISAICLTISLLVSIITKEILRNQANKKTCMRGETKKTNNFLSCKLQSKTSYE